MVKIGSTCKEVLEKTEWVAIVTWDGKEPHAVGTWGDYVRGIGLVDEETIVIPAGTMRKTEENLKKNKKMQLLIASKKVPGSRGPGQGCRILGEGQIQGEGEILDRVKKKFPWARGALVVKIKEVKSLL